MLEINVAKQPVTAGQILSTYSNVTQVLGLS